MVTILNKKLTVYFLLEDDLKITTTRHFNKVMRVHYISITHWLFCASQLRLVLPLSYFS
jgi:hypothetical protein